MVVKAAFVGRREKLQRHRVVARIATTLRGALGGMPNVSSTVMVPDTAGLAPSVTSTVRT